MAEYSIPFSEKPSHIDNYINGSLVTRENFINFLENSFAISRANIGRQRIYMEWVKAQTGFEYEDSIKNLLNNGGWDQLSELEKEHFLSAHSLVPKHKLESTEFPKSPKYVFSEQLSELLNLEIAGDAVGDFVSEFGNLDQINFTVLLGSLDQMYPPKRDTF